MAEENEVAEEIIIETPEEEPTKEETTEASSTEVKVESEEAPKEEEKTQEDELDSYSKGVQSRIKKLTEKYRQEERDKAEAVRLSQQLIEEKFQYGAVPVRVINLAITEMIEELAPNLWEKNLDRCVDFGHTFSPIIEMKNMEYMLHGEAVTLDCLFSSCITYHKNLLQHTDLMRIFNLAKNLKLPTRHKDFMDSKMINKALSDTMKHRNNKQRIPVPVSIGNYKFINDLSEQDILKVTKIYEALS